jgi:hypothetical protein
VWRSDAGAGVLQLRKPAEHDNTGGHSVIDCTSIAGRPISGTESEPVAIIAFDDIVRDVGVVDLLKIDAEGSEYPILLTSTLLNDVREIVGEYHVLSDYEDSGAVNHHAGWNLLNLQRHLTAAGFVVQFVDKDKQGLFHAFRRTAS